MYEFFVLHASHASTIVAGFIVGGLIAWQFRRIDRALAVLQAHEARRTEREKVNRLYSDETTFGE